MGRVSSRIVWLEDKIANVEYVKREAIFHEPSPRDISTARFAQSGQSQGIMKKRCAYAEGLDITIGHADASTALRRPHGGGELTSSRGGRAPPLRCGAT